MFKFSSTSLAYVLLTAAMTILPVNNAFAAPGTLPQAPLFLSTIVQPNVFFTQDDSGSMYWEQMVQTGTGGFISSSGLPLVGISYRYYLDPDWHADWLVLPPVALFPNSWILRNHNGNKSYYNPNVTYTAWAGSKADGTPMYKEFEASDAIAAPRFPNDPTGTQTNLTDRRDYFDYDFCNCWITDAIYLPVYYDWTDTDGDDLIEPTDGFTRVEIAAGTPQMKNFVNWFVYHRKREYTAKASIGSVINKTGASRMGLDVFNNGHQKDAETMTDPVKKRELLEAFYQVSSSGTTPARTALKRVGDRFMTTGIGAPILPASQGGECQQNFNILLSDGFWNGPAPGSIGNEDSNSGGSNNSIFDGDQTQSNDGRNYADAYSKTLADVAMYYYENDLLTLADKVPVKFGNIDLNPQQHLVTYTIAFGLNGTLDSNLDDPEATGFAWPDAAAGDPEKVDDLWHAAYNSRGLHLNAQNPEQLEQSLNTAIADIARRTGTAAAVAINSAQLSTESVVYLAQFESNGWQGNLLAFPIVDTNTGELAATPKWDAASVLNARDFTTKPRTMITYDNSPSVADGVAFTWSDISTDMRNDLLTNPTGGVDSTAVGQARLDFFRGDRSNEATGYGFRARQSMLSDIVNSGPVFVGAPGLNWPDFAPFPEDGEAYSEFKNGPAANRKKVVYGGANDGLMHAFDDETGEELFAYVPQMLSSNAIGEGLHYLTDPNYMHRFYVDQTPTLSDVYISSGTSAEWHTVMVGAMRGGARGLFALNVTEPSFFKESLAEKMVLWEFTDADDADLGYTYSRPFIAYTNAGTWVAIFGNGYNDLGSGEASLFIVNIEKGVDGNWQVGDYEKISTGAGDPTNRNGLSTPALADVDGNGTVDRVYAGDLQGNMWVFDMSSNNANTWDIAYQVTGNPAPLFTTPAGQPLTAKPVLAKHPTQPDSGSPSNAPNIMVFFGSGQYLVDADKSSTGIQSFYGVWDQGDAGLDRTDLIEQTFDNTFSVKVLTRNPIDYSIDHGWYFDLPETGERAVTSPIARADTVFFNSFVPVDDACSVGGFGFKFAVDMATGGSPLEPTFDANNDGVIDEYDSVSNGADTSTMVAVRQEGFLPEPVFIEDLAFTAEEATKVKPLKDIPVGRFSWQELLQ